MFHNSRLTLLVSVPHHDIVLHVLGDVGAGVPAAEVHLVGPHVEGVEVKHVVELAVDHLQQVVHLFFRRVKLRQFEFYSENLILLVWSYDKLLSMTLMPFLNSVSISN